MPITALKKAENAINLRSVSTASLNLFSSVMFATQKTLPSLVQRIFKRVFVNFVSTNTANADFYLVEPATNKIVATFVGEEPWAPEGVTEYGTWDLSAVPAGKYILKMKNHVPWSAVVFNSVTFTAEGNQTTGIENTLVDTTSKKVIENGQIYIIRGNERYNVLGTSVR